MDDNKETASAHTESLGLINAVTTLIKAKLALWEAAEVVEDFIGFKVDADDGHDGPLGWYCACLGGEVEDVKAAHALGLIASLREAKKEDA
jgi:hypothetical protein